MFQPLIFQGVHLSIWVFPKIGVPQTGWFILEIPIKMDDLGGKPTISGNTQFSYLHFRYLKLCWWFGGPKDDQTNDPASGSVDPINQSAQREMQLAAHGNGTCAPWLLDMWGDVNSMVG